MALIPWRKFQAGLRGESGTKGMQEAIQSIPSSSVVASVDISKFLELLKNWYIVPRWFVIDELRIPVR